jgi:5-(carboxyamino)imidazole ribonucleotide synthase
MDYIYEQKEDFEYEISVIVARNKNWEVLIYEPTHNIHENGILRKSTIPAQNSNIAINANIIKKSKSIAKNIAEQMWVIWLLCIEMFVLKDWTIKVNELAPRPHNSWHHTIESYNISQYEALIKAITWTTFWELKLIRKSVLTNLLWNEIKTMPKRKKDKWFCIIKEWNIIWYDYGKDKDLPDSNLPKWRKMWHKVEIF